MPPELKQEFISNSKEYNMQKTAEINMINRERNKQLNLFEDACSASLFLPDYLYEEANSDNGTIVEASQSLIP